MSVTTRVLPELDANPQRLGRHVEHDPRSRQYAYLADETAPLRPVIWPHHGTVLNQGNLGSCTANALVQCLACGPLWRPNYHPTEKLALQVYELATQIDGIPGQYPPDDTGSSGLAACKAGQRIIVNEGPLVTSYRHVFGIAHAQQAIQTSPLMGGTKWFDGEFEVDPQGFVHPTGDLAGGHEYVVLGWDPDPDDWTCLQSWGHWGIPIPGICTTGGFKIHGSDFAALLANQGDITVPIR